MERIMYRKTLDVHKNGIQFLLQGFETADNLSRVIEISLMASGDAIDFPLEKIEALMYVTTPGATEPSINKCTIKDNKVVYEVLPIVEEGITTMQLKLIETSTDGATAILASPKFEVEVTKSDADDSGAVQTTTFTALEDAMAKAKATYDERFLRMELTSDCVFIAYYADGTTYETDLLKRLFYNGNVLLSESYAHGNTGVRAGEDTDNSKYYSNVSKSESNNARAMYEIGKEVLEETKLHGVYTAFSVDFETGEVEYVSPSFKFVINKENGHLDAEGQSYSFEEEIFRVVDDGLAENGYVLADITKTIEEHAEEISGLHEKDSSLDRDVANTNARIDATNTRLVTLENRVTPIALGGTGASTKEEALEFLGATRLQTRTYIGTDIYEDNNFTANSVTLTFDFVPKIVFIECLKALGTDSMVIMINGVSSAVLFPTVATSERNMGSLSITWNDKSVTFTSKNENSYINESGEEYYCVAIG